MGPEKLNQANIKEDFSSTGNLKLQNSRSRSRGRKSEQLVQDHLKSKGWSIVFQNRRICDVEVDILAKRRGVHLLVEVKSLSQEEHIEKILSRKQKARLKAVAGILAPQAPRGLSLVLALVNTKGEIHFLRVE